MGLTGKQTRYLFAKGILKSSGKGKNRKVTYKKPKKKKAKSFRERMKAKKAKMSPAEKHLAKRQNQKKEATTNYRKKLLRKSKAQRQDEYWKVSKKSYNFSKKTGKRSSGLEQRLKIIKNTL